MDYNARMLYKINEARRAGRYCGSKSYNQRIFYAAFVHSADMANNDYYSHTSRDGSSSTDRIRKQGYRNNAYDYTNVLADVLIDRSLYFSSGINLLDFCKHFDGVKITVPVCKKGLQIQAHKRSRLLFNFGRQFA